MTDTAPTLLEQEARLSESCIWTLQQRYYGSTGLQSWASGEIPSYITTNPFIARTYAHLILGFLRDLRDGALGGCQGGEPLYLLELGAGSGQFAFHFLTALQEMLGQLPRFRDVRLRYILADLSRPAVDAWKAHSRLQPLFEAGLLDLACIQAEALDRIQLEVSGTDLTPATLGHPLVVVANYLLDCLPQDAYRLKEGVLEEVRITTRREEGNGALQFSFTGHPVPDSPYADPELNALLHSYTRTLGDTGFLMPTGAVGLLHRLRRLSGDRLLLVAADKAYNHLDEMTEEDPDIEAHGGSLSLMVNFHALGWLVERWGGLALHPVNRDADLKVTVLGMGATALPETTLAFNEQVALFGPTEYFDVVLGPEDGRPPPPLDQLVSLLKLGRWDPELLLRHGNDLLDEVEGATETLQAELLRVVLEAERAFFPLGPEEDLPFLLGGMLYRLEHYGEARRCFHASLELAGEDGLTCYNLGLCEYRLDRPAEAVRWFDLALALTPDYGPAREWRLRVLAEMELGTRDR